MFVNHLRIAWRSIVKHRGHSFINIFGLSIGLTGFVLILLFLNYELSYDKWHSSLERVFRVSMKKGDDIGQATPAPLASLLIQQYPNTEGATAIQPSGNFPVPVSGNNKKIYQEGMVVVDSLFLKVFPYELVQGNPADALNRPDAALLSEEVSRKLFGNENPLGKTVKISNAFEVQVAGVFKIPNTPSHLNAQVLVRAPYEKQNNFWENFSYQTYLKVRNNANGEVIEKDINRIYYNERLKGTTSASPITLFTDKAPDIHNFPKYGSTNFNLITILLTLSILLLLAGAISFSNLSLAQAVSRGKEIGIRKVLGSGKKQLLLQLMTETALQCLMSLGITVLLIILVLPYMNTYFGLDVDIWNNAYSLPVILQTVLCLVIIILLSGLYPSMTLAKFNPVKALKGNQVKGARGVLLRNGLIVMQFIFSGFFIITAMVVKSQIQFMHYADKGFSGEQVIRVQATQKTREGGFEKMKNLLNEIPRVQYVSKTTSVPGDNIFDTTTRIFKYKGAGYRLNSVKISTDYFQTLNIPLKKGRSFSSNTYADQHTRTAVINETAASLLQINELNGQTVSFFNCDSVPVQIIGIVKDFNISGFENRIQPVIYTIGNEACLYQSSGAILVKLDGDHLQNTLAAITKTWENIEPDLPIRYAFLDDNFQKLFLSYQRLDKITTFFALVSVLISAMGLFAITAFLCRQRTKEIGIRKVLGAATEQLAVLLSRDFIVLIGIAMTIAIPVAWWAAHQWLNTFAYHTIINWWAFIATGVLVIIVSAIAISLQTVKAAQADPARNLRAE